ncbi:class I SAM-dependent methyltransferase [Granulicella aggregans]|uniref:class I SAM-dependent methyltransferase n=1 Tax=Granulicella aggregans TaxID=474949 RepID=UPI0021E0CA7E|nr:class I SAM-dependent methyltransferase [Granulicella aggregans]
MRTGPPHFDFIARPYRWLEYLTVGLALERSRLHFLPVLRGRTSALVLGDGDGRFLARLFALNPALQADAVDISPVMLRLVRHRCPPDAALRTHPADALIFLAEGPRVEYDLVITHFFLDCLTQAQVARLAKAIAPRLVPGALWVVTDFTIPSGAMRLPATLLVRFLYLAFRILTGLRISRLPDHHAALQAAGFCRISEHSSLFGILASEVWQWN